MKINNDHSSQKALQPRHVLLFSGHMVDTTNRPIPRFPLDKIDKVKSEIAQILDKISAGDKDLAFTEGANGGDLIFAECCQERGVELQFLQPFQETEFIEKSVVSSEGDWLKRYLSVKSKMRLPILSLPDELVLDGMNRYEACNLWLLKTVMAFGPEKVCFICLWNGEGGDGAGGTAHMIEQVKKCAGKVIWLDTTKLW